MQNPSEAAMTAGSGHRVDTLVDYLRRHGASPLPAVPVADRVQADGCSGPVRACDPAMQALALLSLFDVQGTEEDHAQWAKSTSLWFDRLTDLALRGWLGKGDRLKPTLLLALRALASPTMRCTSTALDAYLQSAQRQFHGLHAGPDRAAFDDCAAQVVQLVRQTALAHGPGWRNLVPIPPAWSQGLELPDAAAACLRRLAGASPQRALAGHALARWAVLVAGTCEERPAEGASDPQQLGETLVEALRRVACSRTPLGAHFGDRVANWAAKARVSETSLHHALHSLSEACASGEHDHDWDPDDEAILGQLLQQGGEAAARIVTLYFMRELLERLWLHPKRPDGRLRDLLTMVVGLVGEHCDSSQTRQVAELLTRGLGEWVGTPYARYTAPLRKHLRALPTPLRLDLDSAKPRSFGSRLAGKAHVSLFQTIEQLAARVADRLKDPLEWAAHPAMNGLGGAMVLRLLEGRFRTASDQPSGRPLERAQLWRLVKHLHDGPLLQAYRRILHEASDVLQGVQLPRVPCKRCTA